MFVIKKVIACTEFINFNPIPYIRNQCTSTYSVLCLLSMLVDNLKCYLTLFSTNVFASAVVHITHGSWIFSSST